MAIETDNKHIHTYINRNIEKYILITHTSSSSLSFLFYEKLIITITTIIIIIYHYLSSSSSINIFYHHHLSASVSLSPSSTIIIVIIIIYHHLTSSPSFQMLPDSEGQGLPHSVTVPVRYSQVHSHMLYGEAPNRTIRNSTQRNR